MMAALRNLWIFVITNLLCTIVICYDIPSVIIIGAGPAGISAATRLLENNITNIRIFEAENRIGGRVHSTRIGPTVLDLGAEYCHGQKDSIVYEKVRDLNVLESSAIPSNIYYGQFKLGEQFSSELWQSIMNLFDKSEEEGLRSESLGEYCKRWYNESVISHFKGDPEKAKIALKAIDLLECHIESLEGSFSWNDPACVQDYEVCEGDQSLTWKDKGYKLFLDILMKKYPDPKLQLPIDEKVFLNREVTQILWDQRLLNNKTIVRTSDNNTYECDHVIFTPSVGVLKHCRDEIFQPVLPEEKIRAIDAIGFDAVMKIILYYPKVWWEHKDGFIMLWDLEDTEKLRKEFSEGPTFNGRPWFTYIRVVIGHKHSPNVLTAWLTGPVIPEVENMDEQALKNGMQYIFQKFFGHRIEIPAAEKVVRTQWYSNTHFRGSYSYQSLRTATKRDGKSSEQVLAEPLVNKQGIPVIQFAGEATNDRHFGTVHGATETGYREADRLIEIYNKK